MAGAGKLNFAILGAGHIAEKMASAAAYLRDEINPYAIASRDFGRAEAMRQRHGFERACGSYGEMLCDGNVDLVYVSTPNSLHYRHARQALEAGKHVLAEKPFVLSHAQCEDLFSIARKKGLFLAEALWSRFHPCVQGAKSLIAGGAIGNPRLIEASFSLPVMGKERVASPSLGGGALLDLGIYAIHFAFLYFGADYSKISSHAVMAPTGVDGQSSVTIEYPDGKLAVLSSSATAALGSTAIIAGDKGSIVFDGLAKAQSFEVRDFASGKSAVYEFPFGHNGYEYELRGAARAIAQGLPYPPEIPWETTEKVTMVMEELRKSWNYGNGA